MSEFLRITDKALVALPWQTVVRWGGLDFELGGTMNIEVYHDPELTKENMIQHADLSELARRMNDPTILNMKPVKSVYHSDQSSRIFYLPFSSEPKENVMNWHLVRTTRDVIEDIEKLKERTGIRMNPFQFFSTILKSLTLLRCWSELNRDSFSSFLLSIDRDLADVLPDLVPGECSWSSSQVVIGGGGVI